MICIIAMVVFAFLGLFSARYRNYAKEAFRCVFRRVTLRKCDTRFDERMKSKIVGKLMGRSQKLAKFIYNYFEPISWVFTVILVVSLAFTINGVYNIAVHGSCNPEDPEGCIFGVEQVCECIKCNSSIQDCECNGVCECTT